jgi:diguanylate cyclase (GGDEF)-like protein
LGILCCDFINEDNNLKSKEIIVLRTFAQSVMILSSTEKADHFEYFANTDPLTQIPNRFCFQNYVNKQLDLAMFENKTGTDYLLFFDLDNFKTVNDTYGHNAGDVLLKLVAKRIEMQIRKDDFLARIGGDEFIVYLSDVTEKNALDIADKLRRSFEENEFLVNEEDSINITFSIGIANIKKGANIEKILYDADLSLYQAKEKGKNRIHIVSFKDDFEGSFNPSSLMIEKMKHAFVKDLFVIHLQPIIGNGDQVEFYECLVRMKDPHSQELIYPNDFYSHCREIFVDFKD